MPANTPEPSGAVELNQGPSNDIPLGGGGTGTVFFQGRSYHFSVGGLGIDGSVIAILQTSGHVYRLGDITRFPGIYRRAPAAATTNLPISGGLWLQNEQSAIMHVQPPPGGRIPDIGNDALRVVLD